MILDYKWLNRLAQMAHCYNALRVVSLNLDLSLDLCLGHNSEVRIRPEDAIFWLQPAIRFRNKRLFQDCMALASGQWPAGSQVENHDEVKEALSSLPPKVREQLTNVEKAVAACVAKVLLSLDQEVTVGRNDDHQLSRVKESMRTVIENVKARFVRKMDPPTDSSILFSSPKYFRALSKSELRRKYRPWLKGSEFDRFCGTLLSNQLVLNPTAVPGKEPFELNYLSFRIQEDLPWDSAYT